MEGPHHPAKWSERRRSLSSGTLFFCLTTLFVAATSTAVPPQLAAANEVGRAESSTERRKSRLRFKEFASGLKASREQRLPVLVFYEAAPTVAPRSPLGGDEPASDGDLVETFDGYLRDSSFKRICRGFVMVRLGPEELARPYPGEPHPEAAARTEPAAGRARPAVPAPAVPRRERGEKPGESNGPASGDADAASEPADSIAARLVLHRGKSALVVLSFREQVVGRYLGELPKRSVLRRELARIAKVNRVFAYEDRRMSAVLEKSLYAFGAGKRKTAVELVAKYENPKSRRRMDDVLKARLDAVIAKYRKVAETEMRKGDLLDEKRQYKDALDTYEVVLQDFPFPDIRKQAAIRKGEIWRELQLFTRIPR